MYFHRLFPQDEKYVSHMLYLILLNVPIKADDGFMIVSTYKIFIKVLSKRLYLRRIL